MWSLGCVMAELFLGWPLYPGALEYDQVTQPHRLDTFLALSSSRFIWSSLSEREKVSRDSVG